MKQQYKIQRETTWEHVQLNWWFVLEGTEEDSFNCVAWFKRREDAELWKLAKEANRIQEEDGL
jgi:hypothetical protein